MVTGRGALGPDAGSRLGMAPADGGGGRLPQEAMVDTYDGCGHCPPAFGWCPCGEVGTWVCWNKTGREGTFACDTHARIVLRRIGGGTLERID